MKKREERKKKDWQKPEFRSLNFSQTYTGTAQAEYEDTWFTVS